MAGTALQKIYCWQMRLDRLDILMASSRKGAVRVGLGLDRDMDCLSYFKRLFPFYEVRKDDQVNRDLMGALKAALNNRPLWPDLALDISATPFQLRVWKAITRIPFGQTKTYGEVARMVGKPKGARAIGQAMGRNPLPLIFP